MSDSRIQTGAFKNIFSGRFGGTNEPGVADPYISGYGWVWFDYFPTHVKNYIEGDFSGSDVETALAALFTSLTPPDVRLDKATQEGVGGLQFSVPSKLTVGTDLTMRFLEMSGTPIYKIIHGWFQFIRDVRTGLASEQAGTEKRNYASNVYYWTTKPDGVTLEQAWLYTGVFPTTDPSNLYTTERGTSDKLSVEITFNVDNIWPLARISEKFGQKFIESKVQTWISAINEARNNWINWSY